jgi:hypothetical protein
MRRLTCVRSKTIDKNPQNYVITDNVPDQGAVKVLIGDSGRNPVRVRANPGSCLIV